MNSKLTAISRAFIGIAGTIVLNTSSAQAANLNRFAVDFELTVRGKHETYNLNLVESLLITWKGVPGDPGTEWTKMDIQTENFEFKPGTQGNDATITFLAQKEQGGGNTLRKVWRIGIEGFQDQRPSLGHYQQFTGAGEDVINVQCGHPNTLPCIFDIKLEQQIVPGQKLVQEQEFKYVGSLKSVPEPLTILGAATAVGFGAFFKRKLNSLTG